MNQSAMDGYTEVLKMNQKHEEFIKELTELSRKYDIWVTGCGLCGSPFAYLFAEPEREDDLQYVYEGSSPTRNMPNIRIKEVARPLVEGVPVCADHG